MTFIASVRAKEGVAIIADSLVTSSRPILEGKDFLALLQKKVKEEGDSVKFDFEEINKLFKVKPSHTKDYEDKLYQYGKFSAITTAGNATINGNRIKKIVAKAISKLKPNNKHDLKSIEKKASELKDYVTSEVKSFLKKNEDIDTTIFILTTYSKTLGKSIIHKLTVKPSDKSCLEKIDYEFVDCETISDNMPVHCVGQNRLSERLLFGDVNVILDKLPDIVQKVAKDFKIDESLITTDYLTTFLEDTTIMTPESISDIKMLRLNNLSLQQAVDLSYLLMTIEIDIQKYTENIPTVGGVVKSAVIDDDGFRYISGNSIVKHETF